MISIIMPIHNTGEYLNESIESLLRQTYENFELICVDDASDDVITRKLLQKYMKQDNRIKLIVLDEKHGAANARNIGMKAAYGEYIIFLDADDIFDITMLEKMYTSIWKNDAEVCICGYKIYSDIEKRVVNTIFPVQKEGVTNRIFQLKEMGENGLMCCSRAPWSKLCKKSFLVENNIYFQNLSSSNDVFFSCMCSICAKKIVYCQNGLPLVSYRFFNKNQISANRNPIDSFRAFIFLLDVRGEKKSEKEYIQIVYALLKTICGELRNCTDEKKKKDCYKLVQEYFKNNIGNSLFEEDELNSILMYFKNEKYESRWFEAEGYFYIQIKENFSFENLQKKTKIIIWGNGMRGKAFQRLCAEKEVDSIMVTDIKNENIGEKTQYGYWIVDTKYVKEFAGTIIATNKKIYKYLLDEYQMKYNLIDLEKYCPWEI